MKAVLHTRYGPPDELQIAEIEKPVPKQNEVLIRVRGASVTTSDCNIRNQTFVPGYLRPLIKMEFGSKEPKHKILGFDFTGDIEEVGSEVKKFKAGEAVFGTTEPYFGAHAEYLCLPEDAVLGPKPKNMSYEEAGTLPVIGNTALHFVRDLGKIQAGNQILINGASGGIGTFAVQIAKNLGAEVTGVCSTKNLELVRSLGADHLIDYTQEDFTKSGQTFDVILDAVGNSSFARCKAILKDKGLYLNTLPKFSVFLWMFLTSLRDGKKVIMEGAPALIKNLLDLKEMVEAGKLKTVIDKTYPLEEIAEAFRYVEGGHKRGNVAITIGS